MASYDSECFGDIEEEGVELAVFNRVAGLDELFKLFSPGRLGGSLCQRLRQLLDDRAAFDVLDHDDVDLILARQG